LTFLNLNSPLTYWIPKAISMLAPSLASYYYAILLLFSTRYLLFLDSFRYSLSKTFKTSPIPSDRSPEDVVESMKQAENACRERHDNRAILALFLPAPEHPVPQPCGPMISANRTACRETSPTHLYGSKCLPVPPIDFPAGSYLRLGPGGYSKDDGIFDGDGIVLCKYMHMKSLLLPLHVVLLLLISDEHFLQLNNDAGILFLSL
jgi:hypothetical protein